MKKDGFVLAETLAVIIFTMFIFTLLYTSAVPILGRYDELSYYDDVDTTYDVYQYKLLLENDANYSTITSSNKKLICSDFASISKCNQLNTVLNMTSNDTLLYFNSSNINNVKNISGLSESIKDYLDYIELEQNKKILLLEHNNYLSYIEIN